MGDAFYRWDGFSYYASFSEFLPSVALALILWSSVALLASILLWLAFRLFHWLCRLFTWKISFEHLLLCAVIFMLSGVLAWNGKKYLWPDVQTTLQVKSTVFFCVALISILCSVLLRKRAETWLNVIQERITPLVWMFGIFVFLSVPLVAYHTLWKEVDEVALQSAQSFSTDNNRPNIILVTFDALTAENMSVYGYEKETTPFITEWAKNATIFTMMEAASNFTTSATASLMTGKRVWTHRTFQLEGTPVKSHNESLPALLKKKGYYNMAFVVNPHASVEILGISYSFDIAPLASDFSETASLVGWQFGLLDVFLYRLFGREIKMHNWILKDDFILKELLHKISRDFFLTTVPPEKVFNAFLDVMDRESQQPFFAWIHVFPPHDPYLPPDPYMLSYNQSTEFRTWKTQEEVKVELYKYLFQYLPFPEEMQPAVDVMRDYYDEFIRYSDRKFQDFIEDLNERNMDRTVIILSADHGESFDHGYFTHGGPFLYEQVTHIPLIIKYPGQNTGQVVSDLVEQIDIPATILDIAKIPVPSWMEGRSLVPRMKGEKIPQRPAFSMNFEDNRSRGHQITKGSVAVWEGDYKLIHYLKKNESLLFNLKQDPDELNDLIDTEPEVGGYLLGLIRDHINEANEKIVTERMGHNTLPE